MCGIAGVFAPPQALPATAEEVRRMVAMLRHRGPDGWGYYRDDRVALGHARLSIVGLSDGHQPLSSEDRRVWISGNGEVFNHVELRRELEAKGHRFRTGSDTEAIVHAYEEWGEDAWGRLNGQFAFALWDSRKKVLLLVRDRLGILPLFWTRGEDGAIAFASEAKALFAGGRVKPAFDPAGLAQVFTRWSATAPDTVFSGMRAVLPGGVLRVPLEGEPREYLHWTPAITPDPVWQRASLDDAADAVRDALDRSVRLRLRADVPVGCYVSGGLDSSVITALAARTQLDTLDSFAVRFSDAAFDETPEQRQVAALYGTRHHEILCDGAMIADALADVVWHVETPLLRTSPVPLFLLSQLVRDSGRKVVLTGEGADELLVGYNIFKEDRVRRFWARQPESTIRPLLLDRLYSYVGRGRRSDALWRGFFGQGLQDVGHPFYSHLLRWQNTAWSLRFLAPSVRTALDPQRMMDGLAATLPDGWRQWSPLARAQAIEMSTFLSGYLLSCQGDRVAMAHGVEVRYPFLDPAVVDLCNGLPERTKLLGLRDKLVLRHAAKDLLPRDVAARPKKPYRAPVAPPLFAAGAPDWIAEVLDDGALARFGIVDPGPVRMLVAKARAQGGVMAGEREEMALVGLVTLQRLARLFLDEFPARADAARVALNDTTPSVVVEPANT
ncbi:MAG: asparagine synthase (glutamine-hydrolyzing) [Rhodospirillaceae bacterium]